MHRRHGARIVAAVAGLALTVAEARGADYAVVVSAPTAADPGWAAVVAELRTAHGAAVLTVTGGVASVRDALRAGFPRYACFVATPAEATRAFVADVHRLVRDLDDDPFTDLRWGILTGCDAAAALRTARCRAPLTVRKVAAGTEVALELCEEGVWYCELNQGHMVRKEKGGAPAVLKGPDDTTAALVEALAGADLFVTSGHATEHDWQIGYRYRNGQFRCEGGRLYGLDTQGRRLPVASPGPKVYMPVGNCLMGHVDGTNAMALAFMNSAGVCQMFGYTVPTWYGYAGWGCLDYFVEQPGRYTFAEAFVANQHALDHRLLTYFPDALAPGGAPNGAPVGDAARAAGLGAQDRRGLLFDRTVLAFYGDPAWEARMAPQQAAWDQALTERDGTYTLTLTPRRGAETFAPVNRNGSQRGGRPIVQFLPRRIADARVLEGADLQPLVADDFVLVPNPAVCDPQRVYRVVFTARAR